MAIKWDTGRRVLACVCAGAGLVALTPGDANAATWANGNPFQGGQANGVQGGRGRNAAATGGLGPSARSTQATQTAQGTGNGAPVSSAGKTVGGTPFPVR